MTGQGAELLAEWRAEERRASRGHEAAIRSDSRCLHQGGKSVQASILRDLDTFFKDIRVGAITVKKLEQFASAGESSAVLNTKKNSRREIALRVMRATTERRKLSSSDGKRL